MSNDSLNRLKQAQTTARELVEALEAEVPVVACLMKAQRLARLLRDPDAQTWIDYELNGYPDHRDQMKNLGSSGTYALRFCADDAMFTPSLPALEAEVRAREVELAAMKPAIISTPVENYTVAGATEKVLATIDTRNQHTRMHYTRAVSSYARHRGALYRYAADTLLALELGAVVESVFEAARARVDKFVAENVPKGAEQLLAANERLQERSPEACAAALTACRRFLVGLADAVFPPQSEAITDSSGRERKVGREEYKNRLLAFLEQSRRGSTEKGLLSAQMKVLAERLDVLNEMLCKGVHDDVSDSEAQLALIETYIFAAEIARDHQGGAASQAEN